MLQGLMGGVTSRLIGVMLTLLGPFCGGPFQSQHRRLHTKTVSEFLALLGDCSRKGQLSEWSRTECNAWTLPSLGFPEWPKKSI